MIGVGFEPTPPKRLVPKTSALDRSAIQPKTRFHRSRYTENRNIKTKRKKKKKLNASIGTRTRILSLEGINTTLVLWTLDEFPRAGTGAETCGHARRCATCRQLASIAQLAEHALSKRKVTSSILVGGFQCSYGLAWL